MNFFNLPYLVLILVYIVIYFSEISLKKNKDFDNKNIRYLCAFLFLFFFGCRGYVGSDWFNYENYYSVTTLKEWTISDYEVGFSFLAKLFHDLGISYNLFVFSVTLIQTLLWNRFLKSNSNQIALSYIVLISIFPLLILDLLRNFTSILIAIQAIEFIKKGKKIPAIIIIVCSTLFHATGIFLLYLIFFNGNYFKRWILFVLVFFGIVVYFLQFNFFNNIVSFVGNIVGGRLQYLASSVTESDKTYGLRFGILEKLLVVFLLLINYKRITYYKLIAPVYFNSFFFYCFILLYCSTSDTIINRFSLLFFWAYVMILCNLKTFSGNRSITILVIALCILKTFVTYNRDIYRYSNNLFTEDSYYKRKLIREEAYEDRE